MKDIAAVEWFTLAAAVRRAAVANNVQRTVSFRIIVAPQLVMAQTFGQLCDAIPTMCSKH